MAIKGYLIRLTRGNKSGSVVARPTVSVPPSITSASSGVYQVGVLLTCVPGVYIGTVNTRAYQWRRNGVSISGATGNTYLPTSADLGTTITCTETVGNLGGTRSTTTAATGTIIANDPTAIPTEFTGINQESWDQRNAIVAQYDSVWEGWTDQAFVTDEIVTSGAAMVSAITNMTRTDLTKWHRIRLDNSTPSNWTGALILGPTAVQNPIVPGGVWDQGHWYGSTWDRASSGGGILIESLDAGNPVRFTDGVTVRGYRGLHFKNIIFSNKAPLATNASRQATSCLSIGYTGYVKPDLNQTYLDAAVVRVEDCQIGTTFHPDNDNLLQYANGIVSSSGADQIDVINCVISGCQVGLNSQGVRHMRIWGNDFQQCLFDHSQNLNKKDVRFINSNYDDRVIHWMRLNTFRNKPNVKDIAVAHSDGNQHGTPEDVGGYLLLDEMNVIYSEVTEYYDQVSYGWRADAAIPADGDTFSAPGVTFTYRDTPTLVTDIQRHPTDNAQNRINFDTTLKNYYAGDPNIWNISIFQSGNYLEFREAPVGTYAASFLGIVIKKVRLNGGTQGIYDDDCLFAMDHVKLCNIVATNTGNSTRCWNGTVIDDRNTYVRVGALCTPPQAGWNNLDVDANTLSQFIGSYTGTVNHTTRNTVVSLVQDYIAASPNTNRKVNGVFTLAGRTLTLDNNKYVGWKVGTAVGSRPTDLMAGTFTSDSNYSYLYSFPAKDGTTTQQEFREALYAILKLSNTTDAAAIGCTDPATWPTSTGGTVTTNVTMTRDVWAWGSSSMQGDQDGSGVTILQEAARSIDSGLVTAGSFGSKTHTLTNGKVFHNNGLGGLNVYEIESKLVSESSGVVGTNQFIILHIGDNDAVTSMEQYDDYITAMNSMKTTMNVGTRPYLLCVNTRNGINPSAPAGSQFGEGISSFLPTMKEVLFKTYSETSKGKVVDFFHTLRDHARDYGLQDATYDETDLRKGYSPRGFMTADGSHMNQHGYKIISNYVLEPVLDAVEGGTPFATRQFVINTAPATPQIGDVVGTIEQYGSGGVSSLDVSNTQSTYTVGSGNSIIRTTATLPTRDLTRVPVKFSKTGRNAVVQPYIWVGEKAAPGQSNLVEFDGYSIIGAPANAWTPSKQMTIAFRFAASAGTDGQLVRISPMMTRQASGRMDVIWGRTSDNGNVFDMQISGNQFNVSSGQKWFLGSINMETGICKAVHFATPAGATSVTNTATAQARLDAAAAGGTDTLRFNFPWAFGYFGNTLHYSLFGTQLVPFKIGDFWLGQGYMDVTDPAVQALFVKSDGNPATNLVNSSDGVVNGVSPLLYCRGNATDWRTCNFLGTQKMAFNNWANASEAFTEYGYLKNA
jgi:hypothetical protein